MTDSLALFSGNRPPVFNANIVASDEALRQIGLVIVQWGSLMFEVEEAQLRLKLLDPRVPESVKPKGRESVNNMIARLKRIAPFIYGNEREAAVKEYIALMDRILRVKMRRDALAHGIFPLVDNQNPDQIVAFYKDEKHHFTKTDLSNLAKEISEIGGTLKGFDSWVHYEQTAAWRDKFQNQTK